MCICICIYKHGDINLCLYPSIGHRRIPRNMWTLKARPSGKEKIVNFQVDRNEIPGNPKVHQFKMDGNCNFQPFPIIYIYRTELVHHPIDSQMDGYQVPGTDIYICVCVYIYIYPTFAVSTGSSFLFTVSIRFNPSHRINRKNAVPS